MVVFGTGEHVRSISVSSFNFYSFNKDSKTGSLATYSLFEYLLVILLSLLIKVDFPELVFPTM